MIQELTINCELTEKKESLSAAMAVYVKEYQYDLSRLCFSLCKNKADADDLYQETWLKAIRFYSKYDSSQQFDKWLFSICVNTFRDTKRRHHITKRISFNTDEDEEQFFAGIKDKSKISEEFITLKHILSELPEKYRLVITLHYFKQYSVADVAEILGIPMNTAKSRLRKAMELIRRGWNK